jgi:hypothetical protein
MATIVDGVLPILDKARALLDEVGLRPFTVTVRTVTWSGERVGLGTATTVDTPLTVADNKRVKVRQLKGQEVVAQGGLYGEQWLLVGPFTPAYSGGGVSESTLNPATVSGPREVYYKVTDSRAGTTWYDLVTINTDSSFRSTMVLRKSSKVPT